MYTLVLAGGSGTRLFPMSRELYPKQFLNLGCEKNFFQQTVERILNFSSIDEILISTNDKYKFLIKNNLMKILGKAESEKIPIILEPLKKNTAPAIAVAIKYLMEKMEVSLDEVVFISPSDHIISPVSKFKDYVKFAEKIAKDGYIITFGINPSKVETGYGYIEADLDREILSSNSISAYKVEKFHEKPDLETAQKYIMSGNYYWNSGMFLFSIKSFLEELEKHSSDIYRLISSYSYEDILKHYDEMPDISIDYAIMEKTDKAVVLPMYLSWSDIGSWDSVYEVLDKDENKNVKLGNVISLDTKDSLIIGSKRLVSTIGLDNVIVVETDDILLIAHRGEGQKVKSLVKILKSNKDTKELVEHHTTVYRPWGSYTELEKGNRYKIKRLTVYPNEALSLQLHHHRSEHWIVVKGTAKVILEDPISEKREEIYIHENESIYVPKSTKHRLVNPGKINLEVIEVQVGEYIEEDDIVRFDDKYNRQ